MGTEQERLASFSMTTVQDPQRPVPQPYFVPVSPKSVRRTQSSFLSGSTFSVTGFPFSLKLMVSFIVFPALNRLDYVLIVSDWGYFAADYGVAAFFAREEEPAVDEPSSLEQSLTKCWQERRKIWMARVGEPDARLPKVDESRNARTRQVSNSRLPDPGWTIHIPGSCSELRILNCPPLGTTLRCSSF
jgi:hypothetical protein